LSGRPNIRFISSTVRINRINVCEEHFFGFRAILVGTMKTMALRFMAMALSLGLGLGRQGVGLGLDLESQGLGLSLGLGDKGLDNIAVVIHTFFDE